MASFDSEQISIKAHAMLHRFFGYKSFRTGQLDVITTLATGHDTVVIMPTGAGKSICYQIPALMCDGCAVIISPLVALMNDQVTSLVANGIPAAAFNSAQDDIHNRQVMDLLGQGKLKLLYISPESFLKYAPLWNQEINISFIAIDEAHCISQWGHDFRPGYIKLNEIRTSLFPDRPLMALTATADRLTREDMIRQLNMAEPQIFIGSFDRPNISIEILPAPDKRRKLRIISDLIRHNPADSGIVYCLTRKLTEQMAASLMTAGFKAASYHAGMNVDSRNHVQTAFRNGELQVVCATIAFGMGIDKSNIRWVVHNNMPANIESYYQEIGRAGRDGQPAKALMFYSTQDIITHRFFLEESGQPAIKGEKLNRMIELTQSRICRRRVLLNYFNQVTAHNCGNCDVCHNPPATFNALRHVQMALSAIIRSGQSIGTTMVIEILRASRSDEVARRGLDRIPTFGVGRDIPGHTWRHILTQMLLGGIIDVCPDKGGILLVTDYGRQLLKSTAPLPLPVEPETEYGKSRYNSRSGTANAPKSAEDILRDKIIELRRSLSKKEGIPPYMIFSDTTVSELVQTKPRDIRQFETIEGISVHKCARYWSRISKALGNPHCSTESITLYLLDKGYSVADTAKVRDLTPSTIYAHMSRLYLDGSLPDVSLWVTSAQIELVRSELQSGIKGIYDRIGNRLPDGMPTLILAIVNSGSES